MLRRLLRKDLPTWSCMVLCQQDRFRSTQAWDPGPRPTASGSRWKSTAYAPLAIGYLKCACLWLRSVPPSLRSYIPIGHCTRTAAFRMLMVRDYFSRDLLAWQAELRRPLRLDVEVQIYISTVPLGRCTPSMNQKQIANCSRDDLHRTRPKQPYKPESPGPAKN